MQTETTRTETNIQHTPGPWQPEPLPRSEDWRVTCDCTREKGHYEVAVVWCDNQDRERAAADARLIAAAPELLAALRVTAGNIRSLGPAGALADVHTPYRQWLAEVEAAIAKVEGR